MNTNHSCCPEPMHNPVVDAKAHRWHHWHERAKCMGCCAILHFILEFAFR